MPAPRGRATPLDAQRVVVLAIGHEGWPIAERQLDTGAVLVVEQVADELRSAVRNDTGWTPAIVILNGRGRVITGRYRVT